MSQISIAGHGTAGTRTFSAAVAIRLFAMAAIVLPGAGCLQEPGVTPGKTSGQKDLQLKRQLKSYIGLSVQEVVENLDLGKAETLWVMEPPGCLRGMHYIYLDRLWVTLYLDCRDPMFYQESDHGNWDHEAFLRARVGGIEYQSAGREITVGECIGWQQRISGGGDP